MKEGWEYKKLGDICSITDFVSNGSFASLKENVKYYNSPNYAVLVRLADASNGFDKSKLVYTDEHGYNFSKKSHLHGGELIMSNVGSVGSMFICPVMKQPMTLAPNTISITSQNNRFLYYYFLSDGFKAKLKGITSSTTLKKFNKTNFKLLEICIPSLSEQQSIVDYLDSAFAKIDAMKANAEKNLNEAKALFQASLKEMLEPKEGWEEKLLPEISENLDSIRKPVTKGKRTAGIYPYYGASGIVDYVDDYLFDEDLLCISEDGANLLMRTYPIAFPISGKVWVNNHAHVLRFKSIVTQKYVEYCFSGMKLDEYITGAAQPKLTQKALNSIIINLPSTLDEQQSIVATLDSLKSKVDCLKANYNKISQECDALKQAILRQVFE